jgi:Fe-S oxidoreductase
LLKIVRLVAAGRAENRLDHFWSRLSSAIAFTFGQSKVLRSPVAGAAHLAIFYGFLVICVGTVNMVWTSFLGRPFLPLITESAAFAWLLDVMAVLVIVGVLVSAYRRYVIHPPEVKNSISAGGVLATIFFLMVSLLGAEAAGSLLSPSPNAPPLGALLGKALSGLNRDGLSLLYSASWWVHVLLVVGFLIYIPHSKHMHLIVCSINEFFRSLRPKGELTYANVDSTSFLGAGSFDQLSWKQLTDLFGCTECGRCQEFCPALRAGRPLEPRKVILDLKQGLLHQKSGGNSHGSAVPDAIGRESIWSCTTCRACQEHCPVFIEHIDKIIEARRFLLESEGASPTLSKALESLTRLGNPMVLPPSERSVFLENLKVPVVNGQAPEIVLWLGCAGTYTPVAQEAITALVKILKAAGVDFAILGQSERCCGDTARRVGEEGLFQELANYNIENLRRLGVKKVLTNCPHCYNTFKNEYPRLGATFSVVHHLEFIADLIAAKRIELSRPFDQAMTYHDPCYLGRYNDVYDLPRQILGKASTGDLLEMSCNRETAVCCGGGGGQMYLESTSGARMNRLRFAEVEDLSVAMVATACPYCKTMMVDAAQYNGSGTKVRVKDVAEVVCDSMAPM